MTESISQIRSGIYRMPPTLRLGTIVQAACCVVPAAALLATGRPLWGGRCFFAALLTMLAFHLLRRNALSYTTLLLAVMPAMMFFRDFLFYSSIQALLLVCMLLWLVVWRERIVTLLTTPGTATLLALATLYWLLSFIVHIQLPHLRTGVCGVCGGSFGAPPVASGDCLSRHRPYGLHAGLGHAALQHPAGHG